ncbi:hypothetical protein IAD21_06341 [Abditibacteriota bacterium]|nr:hypothetical protein IAD21_06341 [Abditibacteriota bacterium]
MGLIPFLALPLWAQPAPDLASDTWAATDALGRTLPLGGEIRAPQEDKFVGIFYFLVHGTKASYATAKPPFDPANILRDNTQISRQVGGNPVTKPNAWKEPGVYWWGEPAVGYFLSDDSWVARRNLTMLQNAGVDVLLLDVTNAVTYPDAQKTLLDAAEALRKEGNATPQFAFVNHAFSAESVKSVYDALYSKGLYRDLWFMWDGKPLILGDRDGPDSQTRFKTPLADDIKNFFTWRHSWANTDGPNGNGKDEWQWIDAHRPQKAGWHNDLNSPEELPVALGGWAHENLGRSAQLVDGKIVEPSVNEFDVAADVDKGLFFAQQMKRALEVDPKFLWITGWNEWYAGRQYGPGVGMLGRKTQPGQYFFVDNYNQEFSRDAMPMRGGFGDNYYMQMVDGIRRFKGARPVTATHGFQSPDLAKANSWNSINTEFKDTIGDTDHRDWPGWGDKHYTDQSGRNDIRVSRVAVDAKNLYFLAKTGRKLSLSTDPNWMQLLIDSDQNPKTGWNGYDYVVNKAVMNPTTSVVARWQDGGWYRIGRAPMKVHGNLLQLTVPRALLKMNAIRKTAFDFHWLDNVALGGDLVDWWYQGESAPDGRFNYRFENQN